MDAIVAALIGMLGVFVGMVLDYFIRRDERLNKFSEIVFNKRLTIYEELYEKVQDYRQLFGKLIEDEETNADERERLLFLSGLEVMRFSDESGFYLSDELTVYLGAILSGNGGLFSGDEPKDIKEKRIENFRSDISSGLEMIRAEAGLRKITSNFKKLTGYSHRADIIKYYLKLRKVS